MGIKSIFNNKKFYLVAALVVVGVFLLINYLCNLNGNNFVTASDAEVRPDLPTRKIQSIEWSQGIVADVCNKVVMSNPYLVIEQTDTIEIKGWAVDIDKKQPLSKLFMEVNGQYFPTTFSAVRNDVTSLLSIATDRKIGFSILFDRNILNIGKSEWADKLRFHGLTLSGDSILSPVEYKLLYVEQEPTEPFKQSSSVQFYIDGVTSGLVDIANKKLVLRNEPHTSIFGWSFEGLLPLSDLFMIIDGKAFSLNYGVERDDVKSVFGLIESNKLGYEFHFPTSLLTREDGSRVEYVEFVPIDASGYVCEKIRYSVDYQ